MGWSTSLASETTMPAADIAAIMSPALPLKFMRSDELIDGHHTWRSATLGD